MDFHVIEKKWQKKWAATKIFEANVDRKKKKFFVTIPYPYMNGAPHVGHSFTFSRGDVYARFKRMQGYNVLFPQGFHATGEPILGTIERLKQNDQTQIGTFKSFGATDKDFIIKLNSRKIVNDLYEHFKIADDKAQKLSKIIDKKNKIPAETFSQSVEEILGDIASDFIRILSSNESLLETLGKDNKNSKELLDLIEKLESGGIKNIVFDPTLMRGFDYYTGIIFEFFDLNPENSRSILGGGRYDDLLDIFGAQKVPAVGFAAGDVTTQDFLATHNLLPKYKPTADIYLCILDKSATSHAENLAEKLREQELNVALDLTEKKVGDQVKIAHKQMIPYIIVVGENEVKSNIYSIKNMETGEETKVAMEEVSGIIRSHS